MVRRLSGTGQEVSESDLTRSLVKMLEIPKFNFKNFENTPIAIEQHK